MLGHEVDVGSDCQVGEFGLKRQFESPARGVPAMQIQVLVDFARLLRCSVKIGAQFEPFPPFSALKLNEELPDGPFPVVFPRVPLYALFQPGKASMSGSWDCRIYDHFMTTFFTLLRVFDFEGVFHVSMSSPRKCLQFKPLKRTSLEEKRTFCEDAPI